MLEIRAPFLIFGSTSYPYMAPKYLYPLALIATPIILFFSCVPPKHEFKRETSFVDVGGKKLQVYTGGEGKNTVVFESGLGTDGTTWLDSGVFDSIGQDNRVIAYDRAGMGKSTQNGETRNMQALANDLDGVIAKLAADGKVILVGHSLGGAIVRTYAIQHPDKVKALLLIEPNNENYTPYSTMSQGHEDTLVQDFKNAEMPGTAMEAAQLIENTDFLKKLPAMPDIPVIVITSIKTDSEMTPENVVSWASSHQQLGKGLTQFTHVKTDKSGHVVHLEEPNLVIENIRKLTKR